MFRLTSIQQFVIPKYNTSYTTTLCLNRLGTAISQENSSTAPSIVKDNVAETDKVELVVGKTTHYNNSEIFEDPNSYSIRIVDSGSKVIVDGGCVQSINAAINLLTEKTISGQGIIDGKITGKIESGNVAGEYKEVLTDNFDGNSLSDNWRVWGSNPDATFETYKSKDNKEVVKCGRDANNISVKDGKLYQTIKKGIVSTEGDVTTQKLYGSKMDTSKNFWFKYGYTEISCKIASGLGFGSGFWLHGDNATGNRYGEYDIVEIYGDSKYNRISPLAQLNLPDGTHEAFLNKNWELSSSPFAGYLNITNDPDRVNWNCFNLEDDESFSDAFHTFGFEWDENYYSFTMDGEVIFKANYAENVTPEQKASYQAPVSVIISINGGNFGWDNYNNRGNSDFSKNNWKTDNVYTVDYLTVYQKDGQHYSKKANDNVFGK